MKKPKKKIKHGVYLSRRLFRVVEDIMPLFLDFDANTPERGAFSRALEYIIQLYMQTEDYQEKIIAIKRLRWNLFVYLTDKEHKSRQD